MTQSTADLVEPLQRYLRDLLATDAPSHRPTELKMGSDFVRTQAEKGRPAELIFICTHNSRRSHLAHVWADTAAKYYRLDHVATYSGGVEATACDVRTVRALRRAGFSVTRSSDLANPIYIVQAFDARPPIECYSKIYSERANPAAGFAAMMCCADVDQECPVVKGAAIRVPLHYEDPKVADDTNQESSQYDQRCLQIGRDMFQMMAMARQQQM